MSRPEADTAEATFVGQSAAFLDLMQQVELAASLRSGIVICGERGSGRQALARAIHARGIERDCPFVALDCREVTGQALEVLLFGHLRGSAGTPSDLPERVSRTGRLFDAHGGTLFLKHPDDLPIGVQSRLARVLRDGEVIELESGEARPLRVRPITAVEPARSSLIEDGNLREDLWERLAVIWIDLPPLRERREDIPVLASHFLGRACLETGVPPKTLTRQAQLLLAALPWRGNVTELRSLLYGLAASVHGRNIRLENVLENVRLDGGGVALTTGRTLQEARANFEREYITAVLERHQGRIADAAHSLGVQRTNLYRKMRTLNVRRPKGRS